MENKDILDTYTPTGGDIKDVIPPYIGSRPYGQPINLNRTEGIHITKQNNHDIIKSEIFIIIFSFEVNDFLTQPPPG
jgi:hypothetical protein